LVVTQVSCHRDRDVVHHLPGVGGETSLCTDEVDLVGLGFGQGPN